VTFHIALSYRLAGAWSTKVPTFGDKIMRPLNNPERGRTGPRLGPSLAYGFGAAGATAAAEGAAAGGFPEELLKNLKKSESGCSRNRVSLLFSPFS